MEARHTYIHACSWQLSVWLFALSHSDPHVLALMLSAGLIARDVLAVDARQHAVALGAWRVFC